MSDKHAASVQPTAVSDFGRRVSDALMLTICAVTLDIGVEIVGRYGHTRFLLILGAALVFIAVGTAVRVILRISIHGLEVLAQVDIDGDKIIGKPDERLILVNARRDATPSRMAEFVQAAAIDPTETHLLRQFTDDEITHYRDALIETGWAEWKSTDRRHGWALLADVPTILRSVSDR